MENKKSLKSDKWTLLKYKTISLVSDIRSFLFSNKETKKLDWIQIWDFFNLWNPQSKSEDRGIKNREFRKLFEQKPKSDLFHIEKQSSHMDFDWMIVSRFAVCLNCLFPTYKYYDRTFMNFDLSTINFGPLFDFWFPIFLILVHLFDCRLFVFHIGKQRFHMDFDWMIISRFVMCLKILFPI